MSRQRLDHHRRIWAAKPVLARVYQPWFECLLAEAPAGARVLEVGAGPGFLGSAARRQGRGLRWFASDLHPVPWNDLAADAGCLPLRDDSVQLVTGLDVLHHLPGPEVFFREAARVLQPGGRLALVEPWITPFSWVVYRFFHQEHCRLAVDPWHPFPPGKSSFDGDAAVPWRLVRDTPAGTWRRFGLAPPRRIPLNAFAYLLSLGFRRSSLLPVRAAHRALAIDRALGWMAPATALRALVVWDRLRA